ncbi:MAG: aminotransferase class V-fold PLP-dependent enzyme [Myxococcota bacterium]
MAIVYLNNAATSFPKPPEVHEAVARCLAQPPVEPGRTGGGADPLQACRRAVASLLGVRDPNRVALLPSCTHALNTALMGLLGPGDHAITTTLEHNSVLRPLAHLRKRGVEVDIVAPQLDGSIAAGDVRAVLRDDTRAVVVIHASNVTGTIAPIESIAAEAAEAGAALVIDAAQSAGCVPIDVDALPGRVFVAFAGHKGLYGPAGTGGLIVPDDELSQLVVGGTGVRSDAELHPGELPLRHEAGTPNLPGFAGLCAGAAFTTKRGVACLGAHRKALILRLRGGLGRIDRVRLAPLPREDGRAGVTSFTVQGWPPEEIGFALREAFGIELRTGLHCAPLVHAWMQTLPAGSVRVSVGAYNTEVVNR